MKLILFVLILFTVVSRAQPPIDVTHYSFDIHLNDRNDSISCTAIISFRSLQQAAQVQFDLVNLNNKQRGMTVSTVSTPGKTGASFSQVNDKVSIIPARPLQINDTATVIIQYGGIPADGLIISKNKYGHRTFFADNWPDRGHNWLACVDDPADKASVNFTVTAPAHYKVVATGIQSGETLLNDGMKRTTYSETAPIPPKVMVIGVADFAVNLAGRVGKDSIPVYSWVYPEDSVKGFYDYAQALSILPFYINYIGPYAYKKLANVQSKTIFGGLENANTIFYFENSITGTRRSESLMAHEIAHQWFGDMATEKSFAHLWLSEGFATYMTVLYMQYSHGADSANKMLQKDRKQVINFAKESRNPVVDTVSGYMELLNANSYQKGGWVLHMLRMQLGDSVFRQSIRNYYAAYAGKNADTRDLQAVIEKTSGKSWKIFFDQWLYRPGIPLLNITWHYKTDTKKLQVKITQTQSQPFQFPIDIETIDTNAARTVHTLQVKEASQSFEWNMDKKPVQLLADPNTRLLFSGNITNQ